MSNTEHTILVVDDLSDVRATISGMLADEGYEVETAGSLTEALTLLKNGHFDLAILDVRLDEVDEDNIEGFDLAAEIRQHWPDMKIVLLTGYASISMVNRALRPDSQYKRLVDEFIEKSSIEELLEIVPGLLGLHQGYGIS